MSPRNGRLFSAGGFIGSTRLPLVARGDKLKLAFGIDEQAKVKRVVVEELKKDPGVFGSTRRLTYAYKIELFDGPSGTAIGSNGTGSYNWNIPKSEWGSSDYTIRITSTTNSSFTDVSDGPFSIRK